MSKELAKISAPDTEWSSIVDSLVEEIGSDLPDDVVRATELLIAGYPTYKAARELAVSSATIRDWLEKYPTMALAVSNGRKLLSKWRLSKLEQQYIQAVEKSEEILSLDLSDREVNSKLTAAIAQHARFIISLFAGQQIDINVRMPELEQTLKGRQDALDYIAQQLSNQRSQETPIEATYQIIDETVGSKQPMLTENGDAPHGKLGEFTVNDNGEVQCHICGDYFKSLKNHISLHHKVSPREYSVLYMVPFEKVMQECVNDNNSSGARESS